MKKIVLAFVIILANGAFISCTDLEDDNNKLEILATDGEDGQDPIEEEDPNGAD